MNQTQYSEHMKKKKCSNSNKRNKNDILLVSLVFDNLFPVCVWRRNSIPSNRQASEPSIDNVCLVAYFSSTHLCTFILFSLTLSPRRCYPCWRWVKELEGRAVLFKSNIQDMANGGLDRPRKVLSPSSI